LAMLMKDDPMKQLVYYQAGIGTYTSNGSISHGLSKFVSEMFALEMKQHIKEGYRYLMENYRSGDQICIFGFSRGAFTARALAGMIQKIGLLPPCNIEQLPFAYAMYDKVDKKGIDSCFQFKRTFSIDVRIKFVGVWDTVESVGWVSRPFPFASSNNSIAYFRHAMALDEHRVKFLPFFYTEERYKQHEIKELEHHVNDLYVEKTDAEEVFFAGAHCDVGGGSVPNGERHSLARIPLRWMIRECFKVNTGIIFDAHMLLHEVGLDIDSILEAPGPLSPSILDSAESDDADDKVPHPSSSQSTCSIKGPVFISKGEPQEELNDAVSPINDELKKLHWKFIDWHPWFIGRQGTDLDGSGKAWVHRLVWNRGKGRIVYSRVMDRGMKVHRSVKTRILAQNVKGSKEPYLPLIRCTIGDEVRPLKKGEWTADKPEHFKWVD